MRKLLIYVLLTGVTCPLQAQSNINDLINCLQSNQFIESYYSKYLDNTVKNGPDIFKVWGLDFSDTTDQLEFISTITENFEIYKSEVKQQTFSHYHSIDSTAVHTYLKKCDQVSLNELREQTGFFDLMETLLLKVQTYIDHDTRILYEAILANHKPLKLIVKINGDSITNLTPYNLSMELFTSNDIYPSVQILNTETFIIRIPASLDYDDIEYLVLTYNRQKYKFGRPVFNENGLADHLMSELNSATNMLDKKAFEDKLYWYLTIDDNGITLKTSLTVNEKLKTTANPK